jgi:hypothetical protein
MQTTHHSHADTIGNGSSARIMVVFACGTEPSRSRNRRRAESALSYSYRTSKDSRQLNYADNRSIMVASGRRGDNRRSAMRRQCACGVMERQAAYGRIDQLQGVDYNGTASHADALLEHPVQLASCWLCQPSVNVVGALISLPDDLLQTDIRRNQGTPKPRDPKSQIGLNLRLSRRLKNFLTVNSESRTPRSFFYRHIYRHDACLKRASMS